MFSNQMTINGVSSPFLDEGNKFKLHGSRPVVLACAGCACESVGQIQAKQIKIKTKFLKLDKMV